MKKRVPLEKLYHDYFELITGRCAVNRSPLVRLLQSTEENSIQLFQSDYLIDQILNWSGIITEIFPETCQILKEENIALNEFVSFFYHSPLLPDSPYDFFKIKLDRFKEFIAKIATHLTSDVSKKITTAVEKEYISCWEAYLSFNPPA